MSSGGWAHLSFPEDLPRRGSRGLLCPCSAPLGRPEHKRPWDVQARPSSAPAVQRTPEAREHGIPRLSVPVSPAASLSLIA